MKALPWTEAEDQVIRDAVERGLRDEAIADSFVKTRSLNSVRQRRIRLGLSLPPIEPSGIRGSDALLDRLREHHVAGCGERSIPSDGPRFLPGRSAVPAGTSSFGALCMDAG